MSIDKLTAYYGLARQPFGRDLAPGQLFTSASHQEAVARIGWLIEHCGIGVVTGEVGEVDRPAGGLVVLGFEQGQVVDPGGCRRVVVVVAAAVDPGVDMGRDLVDDSVSEALAVVTDLDAGEIERVEDQLDPTADKGRVHLVAVALEGDDGGLGHLACRRPQERLTQQFRTRDLRRGLAGGEPLERALTGLGVHPPVVATFEPGGEP